MRSVQGDSVTDPANIQSFPSSVRQPSHLRPPFRARQWTNLPGPAPSIYQVFNAAVPRRVYGINFSTGFSTINTGATGGFQTGERLAPGSRGVYFWHQVQANTTNVGLLPPGHVGVSIYKNGTLVPGWDRVTAGEIWTSIMGGRNRTSEVVVPPVIVPINIVEGDQLDLVIALQLTAPTASWLVFWTASGWTYPVTVEGEAGSIRGTGQDPGVRAPLRNPFG